jgi:hypothetical protein
LISSKNLSVGEELIYVVSYSVMNLGEVKLKVKDKKIVNGKNHYSVIAHIDSYSGIPFVNLHQIYESKINENYYSEFFRGIVKGEDLTSYTEYYFDYNKSSVRVKKGRFNPSKTWTDSTGIADKHFHDGLSIFYYARMNFGRDKTLNVPCFVNEKKVFTKINFYSEVTPVDIDAVNYEIACCRLDGETDFVSIFGLTGYFEGWFTNDEASIPVVAHMKVIIGNVKLELKKWKREGWNPPKFNN